MLEGKVPKIFAPFLLEVVFACEDILDDSDRRLSFTVWLLPFHGETCRFKACTDRGIFFFRALKQVFVPTCGDLLLLLFIRAAGQS